MTPFGLRLVPRSVMGQIIVVASIALLVAQGINLVLMVRSAETQADATAAAMDVARIATLIDHPHRLARLSARGMGDGNSEPERAQPTRYSVLKVVTAPLVPPGYTTRQDIARRARGVFGSMDMPIAGVAAWRGPIGALPPALRIGRAPQPAFIRMRPARRPPPREAMVVAVRLNDGRWIETAGPVAPRDATVLAWLIGQTVILYLAVLIPLVLIARRIARPLRALTCHAQQFDPAVEDAPLAEDGPDDLRQLIAAYNGMSQRVATLLSEKDVMLGAIGHDLKTPLAAMRIRVESVEDESERLRMVEAIDEMVSILDDILTLARLGRSGEASRRVDLVALVETVVDEAIDAGEPVRFDPPRGAVTVALRPVLMRRALRNLIRNAVDYGGEAVVAIERGARGVAVHVADQGPGIAPDQIARMFEPFVRAEASRNRATGGSGLGLTIARAIARAHGGDVTLTNATAGGLIAGLTLPV